MRIEDLLKQYGVLADLYIGGEIYHVPEWVKAKRLGLPTDGIEVTDSITGEFLGIVMDSDIHYDPTED